VAKTITIRVKFLCDIACQKFLKMANVTWSYSKNKRGAYYFETRCSVVYLGKLLKTRF